MVLKEPLRSYWVRSHQKYRNILFLGWIYLPTSNGLTDCKAEILGLTRDRA